MLRSIKRWFASRAVDDRFLVEAKFRALVTQGNEARDTGRWDIAVQKYGMALAFKPAEAAVRVQMGHGLKEVGRLSEAEAAYRMAAAERPDDADAVVQLGHVLKLQNRPNDALAAYALALDRDSGHAVAYGELVAAGARHLLPGATYGTSPTTQALVELSSSARSSSKILEHLQAASVFPIEAWDSFRKTFPTPAPAARSPGSAPALIIIDAALATATQLRVSLRSLMEQSEPEWTAVVLRMEHLADHPVSSLAQQDDRLQFSVSDTALATLRRNCGFAVVFDAGLVLEPEALGWLFNAFERSGAEIGYADHDRHTRDWRRNIVYSEPSLYWMPDRIFFESTADVPALVAMSGRASMALVALDGKTGPEMRRALLTDHASESTRFFHLPLVLSSFRSESTPSLPIHHSPASPPLASGDTPIHVIIPTRDEAKVLRACIDSLISTASKPDRMIIEIVDNRSETNETRQFLDQLGTQPGFKVSRFDEPFNWARINNRAAADAAVPTILVFCNNDVEALTRGWDDQIRVTTSDDRIGVMGVRLLYPDKTVQHAGVVMGANDGRPVHEGLGQARSAPGPNGRWVTRRQTSAVTGAFMAVLKAKFHQLGGFDEKLAVGYNDIDFCLRARKAGLAVVYEPSIELIHYESKTRGRADASKIAWDDEELADLFGRWDRAVTDDPGLNPTWYPSNERPFDGVRPKGRQTIIDWLVASAASNPWALQGDDRTLDV